MFSKYSKIEIDRLTAINGEEYFKYLKILVIEPYTKIIQPRITKSQKVQLKHIREKRDDKGVVILNIRITSHRPYIFLQNPKNIKYDLKLIQTSKEVFTLEKQIPDFNLRKEFELMKTLLKDRTTRKNILWATESYAQLGDDYHANLPIKVQLITNGASHFIKPRVHKVWGEQKNRTKGWAEVFTPTWVVKMQNDLVEEEFKYLPLEEYIDKTWLEITCGEAPYMCNRYDAVTGEPISLHKRVGFVDRKMQRISYEVIDHEIWLDLAHRAYKASFGYEYQGDSLILARENLLLTFVDYYADKFNDLPSINILQEIARIISYNVIQMDGLKYTIPFTELEEKNEDYIQLLLFEDPEMEVVELDEEEINTEIKAKIRNWKTNRMMLFEDLTKLGGVSRYEI